MTSTKDTLKAIQEKLKGNKKPETENVSKVEKVEKRKKRPGKQNAGGTGGRRSGAGRKPLAQDEKRLNIKKSWESYADELVEVQQLDKGTREVRKVKMQRLRIAQDRLFKGVMDGDIAAIKEFNDRVGGKARQPVTGDDEEPPIAIDIGIDRMLDKVYGEPDDEDK